MYGGWFPPAQLAGNSFFRGNTHKLSDSPIGEQEWNKNALLREAYSENRICRLKTYNKADYRAFSLFLIDSSCRHLRIINSLYVLSRIQCLECDWDFSRSLLVADLSFFFLQDSRSWRGWRGFFRPSIWVFLCLTHEVGHAEWFSLDKYFHYLTFLAPETVSE